MSKVFEIPSEHSAKNCQEQPFHTIAYMYNVYIGLQLLCVKLRFRFSDFQTESAVLVKARLQTSHWQIAQV